MIIAETQMNEMPESCTMCDLFRASTLECPAHHIWFGREDVRWLPKERPDWCPLRDVEIHDVKVVEKGER